MDTGPGSAPPPLPRPAGDRHWRDVIADWWDDRAAGTTFVDGRRVALVVSLIVAVLLTVLTLTLVRRGGTATIQPELTLPQVEPEQFAPAPATAPIVVHVAGAVLHPGVYELLVGARAVDALTAAGGAEPAADLDRLNLAAPLVDGDRLFVPEVGQVDEPPLNGEADGAGPGGGGVVDVNRASAQQLESLPGIGPALAASIVAYRDEHGPFAEVSELLDVPGIGPAKLDALTDLVSVS